MSRITTTVEKYKPFLTISDKLEQRKGERDIETLIDYYSSAIKYIHKNWDINTKINYCFWGVNNNAVAIHRYIKEHYPNAKLVKIFDTFKVLSFEGITSSSPKNIEPDGSFIFITSFVVGYIADKFLQEKNISRENYFICRREYITSENLFS